MPTKPSRLSSMPWTPHAYQKKAVKFLLEHAASALFLTPGLGKTAITLAAIKLLKKQKVLDKVLVLAPLRVAHSVWPKELQKWSDFHGLKLEVLHGPDKDAALKREADIYVVNYEGLDWLLQTTKTKVTRRDGKVVTKVDLDLKRFKELGFDTLIVDELSKMKHTNTNRFKALKLVLGTFRRRWGLTGSPAANGLLDLFGQCFVLDQGRTLGPYITHYQRQYFDPSYDGFSWTLKDGADQLIYERLRPLALRLAAEDYLALPELIENNIMVTLPTDVQLIYDDLERDLIAKLEDHVIVASTAGAASVKVRQIVNGGIWLNPEVTALVKLPPTKREWVNLHTEKVDALADLIDELQGEPLLVAYDFQHDLDRLQTKLGKEVPYIGGGVSAKRATELERLWNAGKLPVLLGHPQSIAHGLNLQEAGRHVCWHSLTYDYELYDQFIRRVWRQGNQAKKVFVHHILAEGTIDELILDVVKAKGRTQNALFAALKKLTVYKSKRT